MKLLGLSIDQFGPWTDLTLNLPGDFATFYGPNEAGKSSMMKFVRGVLFGFKPSHPEASGSLLVELDGTQRTLRRSASGDRGHLLIEGVAEGPAAERWLSDRLGGVGEDLFVSIFAIGLEDMQQLAALEQDAIADSIYGLSLGPEGERLMAAHNVLADGRDILLSSESQQGRMTRLLRRRTDAADELAGLPDAWERFDALADDIEATRRKAVRFEKDREELRRQIRGLSLLERAHKPWARQRELKRELDRLGSFSPRSRDLSLSRLDELESAMSSLDAEWKNLRGEESRLKRDYNDLAGDPKLSVHACRIDALLEEERPIREQQDRAKEYRRKRDDAKQRLEAKRRATSSLADIRAGFRVSNGASEGLDLHHEADAYKAAKRRYKRLQKRYESASRKQSKNAETLKAMLEGRDSAVAAREAVHAELKKLEGLHTLVQKERLLEARQNLLRQAPSGSWLSVMPDFINPILWFFAIAGAVLFFAGAMRAVTDAWVIGAIYSFAGLSFLGISWTLGRIGGAGAEGGYVDMMRETEQRLRDTRRDLDRLDPPSRPAQTYRGSRIPAVGQRRGDIDETVTSLRRRLIELDRADELEAGNRALRDKLTTTRQLLRTERQRVSDARQAWLRALRQSGLAETLNTTEALDAWRQQSRSLSGNEWDSIESAQAEAIQEAVEGTLAQAEMEKADALHKLAEQALDTFNRKIADLAGRLDTPVPHGDSFAWLRRLQQDVAEAERKKKERLSLRSRRRDLQSSIASLEDKKSRQKRDYESLLGEFGVSSRDELQLRMREQAQAEELRLEIDELGRELVELSSREPELALTEDAFLSFDASHAAINLRKLEDQIEEIELELEAVREQLGRLENEREELASSRTASRLRFDRDQADADLDDLAIDFVAAGLAADAIEEVRATIEANAQPATLMRAGEYLNQLTVGRYIGLTTDADERTIAVLDEEDHPWAIEKLSTGTCEQVFLALRLAIADEFAADGGQLPLVLDDVLVNFDQDRTEAALATLAGFTEGGQQVLLFTCHRHVAGLLAKQGYEAAPMPRREGLREAA